MDPFSLLSRILPQPPNPLDYRLGSSQEDFVREGLRPRPQRWEDGRRIRLRPSEYEWWYFDGHFEDGSTAVGTYAVTWRGGKHVYMLRIAVTDPAGKTWSEVVELNPALCTMLAGECDVRMSGSRFVGDGDTYEIVVDPTATGGIGWDLRLTRRVPAYRPGTGVIYGGEHFFAWVNAVPEGELVGSLTYDGKTVQVRGSGYHDHNWGDQTMPFILQRWTWGRVKVGDYTVVAAQVFGAGRFKDPPIPILLVTHPDGVLVDAFCADVTVNESGFTAHPDPRNDEDQIPRRVSFLAREGALRAELVFERGKMIESTDMLSADEVAARPWQIGAAELIGLSPWYTRFLATCTLTIDGRPPETATGTLEFMDLR